MAVLNKADHEREEGITSWRRGRREAVDIAPCRRTVHPRIIHGVHSNSRTACCLQCIARQLSAHHVFHQPSHGTSSATAVDVYSKRCWGHEGESLFIHQNCERPATPPAAAAAAAAPSEISRSINRAYARLAQAPSCRTRAATEAWTTRPHRPALGVREGHDLLPSLPPSGSRIFPRLLAGRFAAPAPPGQKGCAEEGSTRNTGAKKKRNIDVIIVAQGLAKMMCCF